MAWFSSLSSHKALQPCSQDVIFSWSEKPWERISLKGPSFALFGHNGARVTVWETRNKTHIPSINKINLKKNKKNYKKIDDKEVHFLVLLFDQKSSLFGICC